MLPLSSSARPRLTIAVLLLGLAWGAGAPAMPAPGYRLPPQALVDIVDRPLTPRVRVSPDRQWLLLLEQPSLPAIAELAETELRLGGLRFKPRNHSPSRRRPASGLALVRIADRSTRTVEGLPAAARIDDVIFSPDGSHIAFTHTSSDRVELWLVEVATATARRLTATPLTPPLRAVVQAPTVPEW